MSKEEDTIGSECESDESEVDIDPFEDSEEEEEAEGVPSSHENIEATNNTNQPPQNQPTPTNQQPGKGRGGRGQGRGRGRGRGTPKENPPPPKVPVWTSERKEPVIHEWVSERANPGPRHRLAGKMSPLELFRLFFTDEMMEMIIEGTNAYAQGRGVRGWKPLSKKEFEVWLGLIICFGIHKLPSVSLYWSEKWIFQAPQFSCLMTMTRFLQIKANLHFVPPSPPSSSSSSSTTHPDPLRKIRKFLDLFVAACESEFLLGRDVSMDEMMVKSKSKYVSFRVRQPLKPIRDGVKIFAICDATTGYLFTFLVYDGTGVDPLNLSTKTASVVASLVNRLPNQGHFVFMDNFFSTVALFRYIHSNQKQNAVGTARINRLPSDISLKKSAPKGTMTWRVTTSMSNGEAEEVVLSPILAYGWRDCGVVYFLSTAHEPNLPLPAQPVRVERRKGREKVNRPAPPMAREYWDKMGGVDLSDQYRSSYTVHQKSKRWYMALFYWVVDCALSNAFLCYATANRTTTETGDSDPKKTSLAFRSDVAFSLVHLLPSSSTQNRFSPPPKRTRYNSAQSFPHERAIGKHYPCRATKARSCRNCYAKKPSIRHDVKFKCKTCDVHLCIDCFEEFHESANK